MKEYEFDKQQILNKMLDKVKLKKLGIFNQSFGLLLQIIIRSNKTIIDKLLM